MSWRDIGVQSVIDVGWAGELQYRRNDHDNGDIFYSIWFYPRDAAPGDDYTPRPFYYVAWARVPATYDGGPIPITLHHNVAEVSGMQRDLPSLSVPDISQIEPALELLGRGLAAAFDTRRPRPV